MKFKCPGCGKILKTESNMAGKVGKCPACGKAFKVPSDIVHDQNRPEPVKIKHNPPASGESKPIKTANNETGKTNFPKYMNLEQNQLWAHYHDYIISAMRGEDRDQNFFRKIGFFWRSFQYIIDLLPIAFFGSIIYSPIEKLLSLAGDNLTSLLIRIALYMVFVFLMILYWAFMESSQFQGSLGKIVLDFKVTDLNGQTISFQKALIRNLIKAVQFIPPLLPAFLFIIFNAEKQGLHDRIAGTVVVLDTQGIIWYYQRRWVVLWLFLFSPLGLLIFML